MAVLRSSKKVCNYECLLSQHVVDCGKRRYAGKVFPFPAERIANGPHSPKKAVRPVFTAQYGVRACFRAGRRPVQACLLTCAAHPPAFPVWTSGVREGPYAFTVAGPCGNRTRFHFHRREAGTCTQLYCTMAAGKTQAGVFQFLRDKMRLDRVKRFRYTVTDNQIGSW